jgi:glucose dehydrogenase
MKNNSPGQLVRKLSALIVALCLIVLSTIQLHAGEKTASPARQGEWPFHGGDPGGMRFSPLKQINRKNVIKLKEAWTYHMGELERPHSEKVRNLIAAFECTPLVVDGVLYLSTPSSRVIALDAETGQDIWKFDPQENAGQERGYLQHRGVAYWEGHSSTSRKIEKRILYATWDGKLIALDARTGKRCSDFGKGGIVDLRQGEGDRWPHLNYTVTSPPAIYKDRVICGSRLQESPSKGPSGDVRAFDVSSGNLVWQFHTVPRPGEFGNDTWEGNSWKDRSGTNVWSTMSVDTERGMVFLPIGSPAIDADGRDRKGQNLFGNSLVALDAATGKRLWHFQMVHHDLWDYDLPAQPNLVVLKRGNSTVPAVALITKMGLLFVLNRVTGEPIFPVEERPVAASKVPDEEAWPTQPFPVKPPPLVRLTMTARDISTVTPASNKFCTDLFNSLRYHGIYTPPGPDPTLMFPGSFGGGNWSGASYDPSTNYLYVNVNELGNARGRSRRFWDENLWPCQTPPWGTLNAVDLNKGEIVWKVPLGVVPELEARGVPKTGTPSLGGTIVTAGGLVFIAGTYDSLFRAFDSTTGKELWTTTLPANGHATPMTYLGKKNGKQYVVIAAGGGGAFSQKTSDALVAYALPAN